MLIQFKNPRKLDGPRLDSFLAGGWFRSGNGFYKSNILCIDGGLFTTVHIRLLLDNYLFPKRLGKLWRKNNERFRVVVQPASINRRKETLYRSMRKRFKSFVSQTLTEYFDRYRVITDAKIPQFNTWEIEVYDQDQLVAVSFFDLGETGAASILCLHDEAYGNFSLGTFTMLHEINVCKQLNMRYYYPGYVLDGNPIFDYKLRLGGTMQYKVGTTGWMRQEKIRQVPYPARVILQKHSELEQALQSHGINFRMSLYPLFTLSGAQRQFELKLLGLPILCFIETESPLKLVAGYDFETATYQLLEADSVEYRIFIEQNFETEFKENPDYFLDLLTCENMILTSPNAAELAAYVQQNLFLPNTTA